MSTAALPRTSYDDVPYESFPYPQTHIERLATLGSLLGLKPKSPTSCRVLELGCSSGGNLIPMAWRFPQSEFVGIDASRVQIDQGLDVIRALDLTNIRLLHLDIRQAIEQAGTFDYLICHGVYSWVPAEVQQAILAGNRSPRKPAKNTRKAGHMFTISG